MLIPVSHLTRYGTVIGSVLYDTETDKFSDSRMIYSRSLPLQDYDDCSVISNNCVTVVGKIYGRNTYACCFGDNFCYELDKHILSRFVLSNIKVDSVGKYHCIDGKLDDLSYLFPDSKIKFVNLFNYRNVSSRGVSRKFFALYSDKLCIIKFTKKNNEDLHNEVLYKNICDVLEIPCCDAILSEYYGKECIVSVFNYNINNDIYISFKNLNKSFGEILKSLSDKDKWIFDKYMLLDYILLQEDRHYSNLAVVNNRLYPLFDNGECLGFNSISYFSSNFRSYVERLDKNYLRSLCTVNNKFYELLNHNQISLVKNEVNKIW